MKTPASLAYLAIGFLFSVGCSAPLDATDDDRADDNPASTAEALVAPRGTFQMGDTVVSDGVTWKLSAQSVHVVGVSASFDKSYPWGEGGVKLALPAGTYAITLNAPVVTADIGPDHAAVAMDAPPAAPVTTHIVANQTRLGSPGFDAIAGLRHSTTPYTKQQRAKYAAELEQVEAPTCAVAIALLDYRTRAAEDAAHEACDSTDSISAAYAYRKALGNAIAACDSGEQLTTIHRFEMAELDALEAAQECPPLAMGNMNLILPTQPVSLDEYNATVVGMTCEQEITKWIELHDEWNEDYCTWADPQEHYRRLWAFGTMAFRDCQKAAKLGTAPDHWFESITQQQVFGSYCTDLRIVRCDHHRITVEVQKSFLGWMYKDTRVAADWYTCPTDQSAADCNEALGYQIVDGQWVQTSTNVVDQMCYGPDH